MNKPIFILIIFFICFMTSCSSDSNDDSINGLNDDKNVKREYVSDNFNIEYRYNENNLLTRIIDIQLDEGINSQTDFSYDQNNNVIERHLQSNNSNFISITSYTYDNDNKLISAVSSNNTFNQDRTQTLTYNGNIITINTNYENESSVMNLEMNSTGLIIKVSETSYYSLVSYDSNENITEINTFDNDNNLLNNHIYSYDNKPNPFYGQLNSIYLIKFINAFRDASVGEFVWDGYEGYLFPFLKNNITTIIEDGNLDRNYSYSYDADNYPIRAIEIFNGNNTFEFDIEYD